METVLWVLTAVLAGMFVIAGATKAVRSKEQLVVEPRMAWTEDFSPGLIRTLGVLELVGAVGLVLPGLLDAATVLVPVAAVCLAVLMVGAVVVHLRRGEVGGALMPAALLVGSVLVAWGRFGPYPL